MKLSEKQLKVLANSLAWCEGLYGHSYEPTQQEIDALFAYTDRGRPWPQGLSTELLSGWVAHYSNPFAWIPAWERGDMKNPPLVPPAAWIYEAYWSKSSDWCGWFRIALEAIDRGPCTYPMFDKIMHILNVFESKERIERLLKRHYVERMLRILRAQEVKP